MKPTLKLLKMLEKLVLDYLDTKYGKININGPAQWWLVFYMYSAVHLTQTSGDLQPTIMNLP